MWRVSGFRLCRYERKRLTLVVLPQALRAVTPSLIGRVINLVIYTSVVSILGVLEFTRAAVLVNNR